MRRMAANKVTAVHRLDRLPTQSHLKSRLSRGGFFFGEALTATSGAYGASDDTRGDANSARDNRRRPA
jgi:hypothetical protein